MARPAGRATAATSGALFSSTDLAASLLSCSPASCALAVGAIAADTANKAALATARHHPLPRSSLAILLSLEAICRHGVSPPARDDNRKPLAKATSQAACRNGVRFGEKRRARVRTLARLRETLFPRRGRSGRSESPSAGSAMLDDADAGAPEAQGRPGGFALQDPDLVREGASQCRGRVQRDIGVVAGAVNPVDVGLAGQGPRAGEHRYPDALPMLSPRPPMARS